MMANGKLHELNEDLAEWKQLLSQAKRTKVKDCISLEIKKIETIISDLKSSENTTETTVKKELPAAASTTVKRYEVELTNYAWDQSDKYLKLFVTLDGVQTVDESSVECDFTANSIRLMVYGLNDKNYKLIINNLLEPIVIEKSYRKVKTNLVSIYAKKQKEALQWSHLTSVEKRIQASKPDKLSGLNDTGTDTKDPTAGLFNMMKNLYQSGDPEMKRMISKAWVEGEEKKRSQREMDGGDFEF